jgi:hypothetical protein
MTRETDSARWYRDDRLRRERERSAEYERFDRTRELMNVSRENRRGFPRESL